MMANTLDLSSGSGFVLISLTGEFDMSDRDHLDDLLQAATQVASHVFVDLSGVTFLDSSALAALMACHKQAVQVQRELSLVGPTERIHRLLTITHLDQLLPVHDTLDEAEASIRIPH